MKRILVILILGLLCFNPCLAQTKQDYPQYATQYFNELASGQPGRFTAISTGTENKKELFIIDTKEGHIWVYAMSGGGQSVISGLIYLGRLYPGQKHPEVIIQDIFNIPK